jgi:hypothetical protein
MLPLRLGLPSCPSKLYLVLSWWLWWLPLAYLNFTSLPWPLKLWEGLYVRSTAWSLNLACCMKALLKLSELPDLQKSTQVSDEGGDSVNCT